MSNLSLFDDMTTIASTDSQESLITGQSVFVLSIFSIIFCHDMLHGDQL